MFIVSMSYHLIIIKKWIYLAKSKLNIYIYMHMYHQLINIYIYIFIYVCICMVTLSMYIYIYTYYHISKNDEHMFHPIIILFSWKNMMFRIPGSVLFSLAVPRRCEGVIFSMSSTVFKAIRTCPDSSPEEWRIHRCSSDVSDEYDWIIIDCMYMYIYVHVYM